MEDPKMDAKIDDIDSLIDQMRLASRYICNSSQAQSYNKIQDNIRRKAESTPECQNVYYRVTWNTSYGAQGECRYNFEIEFSDRPINYGVICALFEPRGIGDGEFIPHIRDIRQQCGSMSGAVKGAMK